MDEGAAHNGKATVITNTRTNTNINNTNNCYNFMKRWEWKESDYCHTTTKKSGLTQENNRKMSCPVSKTGVVDLREDIYHQVYKIKCCPTQHTITIYVKNHQRCPI